MSHNLCDEVLADLEHGKRPILKATKCSLDNSIYKPNLGFLTPGPKKVKSELNVASVKKMSRAVFMLEMLLRNVYSGGVNTKRELYYMCKGLLKQNADLKPLDFDEQNESDSTIDYLCEILEFYQIQIDNEFSIYWTKLL